ncbi:hypothetical protein IMC75_07010 [Campylobacter peloridis]|uniref:Lipoprotein n=1 Tax=Campylobacter peloridis TaxID=488546 RepID=A0ABX6TTJ3_9BACT|nr:hypothetical protein [Campylobacter peloridis]AJC84613.1 hypothetical protein CPEL_0789 [Campylobacter peloridis LMG 23910]QOQ88681.1 hypothetical protein IMC75_07010 [Campylobacter peloridis]
MKKLFTIIFLTFIFTACSYKNQEQSIINLKSQTLMYAQKINFQYKNDKIAAVFSYLNPVLDEKSQKEIFILSFIPNANIAQDQISILIDGKKTLLTPLKKDDKLFKYIIKSDYASYYKITLDELIQKPILQLNSCFDSQCFELKFQKISKSVYYRSEDANIQHN